MQECGLGSYDSEQGTMAGFCEHCNENFCSIEDGKSNDQLSNYWDLKEDFSPWISFNSYEQASRKTHVPKGQKVTTNNWTKNEDIKK